MHSLRMYFEILKDYVIWHALAVCALSACMIIVAQQLKSIAEYARGNGRDVFKTMLILLLGAWAIVNGTVTNASKSAEGEQNSGENGLMSLNDSFGVATTADDSSPSETVLSGDQSDFLSFTSFSRTECGMAFDISWRGEDSWWIDLYATPRLGLVQWEYLDSVLTYGEWSEEENDVTVTHGEVDFTEVTDATNDYSSACFLAVAWGRDTDGDWLLDGDELYIYATDPENADTDYDGICDGDEVDYGLDPKNPHTLSEVYCDGVAMRLGGIDPFSYPEGSTNTVWEYVFYTGSTNMPFAYPHSSDEVGVLRVTASGSGSGELIVGDKVVPLLAPPTCTNGVGLLANDIQPIANDGGQVENTLLVSIGKGERKQFWYRKSDGLVLTVDSDDLFIGELPTNSLEKGWIAFPHTVATVPCIHDLSGGGKTLSLVHGEEFEGLSASWSTVSDEVVITNLPPVSAVVHGTFERDGTRAISYRVTHPDVLNVGRTEFVYPQTLRFCPPFADYVEADQGGIGGNDDFASTGEQTDILSDNDLSAAWSYTNMMSSAYHESDHVLRLYGSNGHSVSLTVPEGDAPRCCECPEHNGSNYVACASCSSRLKVLYPDGSDFTTAYTSCTVRVTGVEPSRSPNDSSVLFVTNGIVDRILDFTVLGIGFDTPEGSPCMREYNELSAFLGYPITINTNLVNAAALRVKSDVLLSNGVVRLAFENATGSFKAHLPEWSDNSGDHHAAETLLSTASRSERYFTMREWRGILARYGKPRELGFLLTSSSTGRVDLVAEYVTANGSARIRDIARQRVTSVLPPLQADYNRDGVVDDEDVSSWMKGRTVYFWRNDDDWKGDDAFDTGLFNSNNCSDDVVNGRNDLVNFLPIFIDASELAHRWNSGAVKYFIEADDASLQSAKIAFVNLDRNHIGDAPLGNCVDSAGDAVYEADLSELGAQTRLSNACLTLAYQNRCAMLAEFPSVSTNAELRLAVYSKADDKLLFTSGLRLHVGEVEKMTGWINIRDAADGDDGLPTRLATDDWPACEHGAGNLVFVHGYNMAEDAEVPYWAKNVFKKLWWSGLNRGFIAVQWHGNEGQVYIPGPGFITPNYYGNVQNAFKSASALASVMANVQGPKWYLAHSLGNMLVCAAIQDYALEHEKYFMLNAAVPLEALDPVSCITQDSHDNMTPRSWTNYTDRVRSTHWYELFSEGDGRRLLTWKGRFSSVTNIVNFYSSQEEVVNNGDGEGHSLFTRNFVWYNQETKKGLWPMMLHEYEGGWEFNSDYDRLPGTWAGNTLIEERRRLTSQEADDLSDSQLRAVPFFLDFDNPEMHSSSNGLIVSSNYLYRAEMLGYAIPSESYAVGANQVPLLVMRGLNFNMADYTDGQSDLPVNGTDADEKYRDWQHSTFVKRSYKRTHQLYNQIIELLNEENQNGQ